MIRINPTTIKQNFSRTRFGPCRLTAYLYIVFLYIFCTALFYIESEYDICFF